MNKKIILFMTIATMSLSIVGCSEDDNSITNSSHISSSYTSEKVSTDYTYETIAIPEDGWTVEELVETVRINGKSIEVPFTVESLGEGYSINEEDTQFLSDGSCGTVLYYGDAPILAINYENLNSDSEIKSKGAYAFSIYQSNDENYELINEFITINGVKIGATKSEVVSILGEADKEDNSYLGYEDKSTGEICVGLFFDKKEKLSTFTVIF